MSDIIHLLPDAVANQIAAGEVIQRPSSVIKELVENAIDAGAALVQVFVTDAGKTSIQVVDDGKGMSETDARLSFERHATSKIASANDLFALRTMGFRGEALASIAAVAQVELKTRREEDELGTHLVIEGSRFKSQNVTHCPRGANFLVKNLFYNIPARRKFLKSNTTEMSNIVTEFERIALANPHLAFRLFNGDTLVLDLPKGNFRQRIVNIFGRRMDSHLIPVQVETSLATIKGFVGSPESSRKKGAQQYFFVNGRYMRHPYFGKAVQMAFERLLPEGEQVPYFLTFEVDPANIDVNIHPTKTEIKFEDEQAIWQILSAAIRESLGKFNAIPTIDFDVEDSPEIPIFSTDAFSIAPPEISVNSSFNPFTDMAEEAPLTTEKISSTPRYSSSAGGGNDWKRVYEQALQPLEETPSVAPTLYDTEEQDTPAPLPTESSSYLQFQQRYILTTAKNQLLIIDQHRAHRRVLYDQFLHLFSTQEGVSQGLLFPIEIELPPSLEPTYSLLENNLLRAGFDLNRSADSPHCLQLKGIPSGTEGIDPATFLQEFLAKAAGGELKAEEEVNRLLATSLSQSKAIPSGKRMTEEEMTHLVEALFHTETPTFTPEGAKILVMIDERRLENFF